MDPSESVRKDKKSYRGDIMVTTKVVRNYYNNFLEHLKHDHKKPNLRHIEIKKDLSGIIKKDMNVLDLGCGTGVTTRYIAELGAKVIGVDLSPKLIEFAKANSTHENTDYWIGDITKINFGKKKFDAICLCDIIEHIPREKIPDLLKNIEKYSFINTIIYLNIPDARLQSWLRKNRPEKLQIVDKAYSIIDIVGWFGSINFEAVKIKIYGVNLPLQYTSYIFVRKDVFFHSYNIHLGNK